MTETRLEHVAASMYRAIKWGGWCAEGWEHERPGLREHYLTQAIVAVKAMQQSYDPKRDPSGFIDMIYAILTEKPKAAE